MAIPKNKRGGFRKKQVRTNDPVTGLPYEIDPVTGKQYTALPSLRKEGFNYNAKGAGDYQTELHAVDLNMNDLNAGSAKYLPGRLRQPPNREEMQRLIAERKLAEMKREQIYVQSTQVLLERDRAKEEKTKEAIEKRVARRMGK